MIARLGPGNSDPVGAADELATLDFPDSQNLADRRPICAACGPKAM